MWFIMTLCHLFEKLVFIGAWIQNMVYSWKYSPEIQCGSQISMRKLCGKIRRKTTLMINNIKEKIKIYHLFTALSITNLKIKRIIKYSKWSFLLSYLKIILSLIFVNLLWLKFNIHHTVTIYYNSFKPYLIFQHNKCLPLTVN